MSLHALANHMASKGRGDDSMLVHMTPGEVAGLHALALKHGGSLTINPETGLVEAGFLKKLLPMIAGFALGPAGFGLMSAAGAGLAVGAATGLATGSLSKGLMAGLGAYGGAGLGEAFMGAGANVGAGAGANLASSLTDAEAQALGFQNAATAPAANAAATSSLDKLGAGFKAVTDSPSAFGQFAKDNWKMGLAAASPFIADAMVPTTTKMPTAPATGYIRPFQYDANTHTVRSMDPVLASEWGARQFPDFIPRTQPQIPPPRPGGMAAGGIVALAGGGEADPYAQYNTMSGQSKNAYDYLMGDASAVDAAPIPTFNRPVVSNTNAPPPPPPAAPTPAPTPVSTPAPAPMPMPEPTPQPVMPSPDEDFPPTPQPVMPSPDADFPPTPQPVMPSPDADFPSTYVEPPMPSPDADFPPTPATRELEDKSYWDDTNSPEPVGPTRGQPELPEEFDRYLQPEPVMPSPDADFPSTFSNDTGYGLSDFGGSRGFGGSEFGGGGGGCPAPWINILLADGSLVKASDIQPGMEVYTRHEHTNEWGVFPVSVVRPGTDERWIVKIDDGREFVGTFNHPVMVDGKWVEIKDLKSGDKIVQPEGFAVVKSSEYHDHGPIVKIEVKDAHTYISEGFLSHNKQLIEAGGGHDYFDNNYYWADFAEGGMVPGYAMGGLGSLGGYSDGGRLLKGPGDGVSDSIPATIGTKKQPARLADGEFVVPARIVSELGNGSTDAGARKLYAMMDRIQKNRSKTVGKGKVATNTRADKHLPA